MPRAVQTIADLALDTIHVGGPQSVGRPGRCRRVGWSNARSIRRRAVTAALDPRPRLLRGWDDRWFSLADQLEGAICTCRLTGLERRNEVVLLREGLYLVERLALRGRPFNRTAMSTWTSSANSSNCRTFQIGATTSPTTAPGSSTSPRTRRPRAGLPARARRAVRCPGGRGVARLPGRETQFLRLIHGPAGWLPRIRHERPCRNHHARRTDFDAIALDRETLRWAARRLGGYPGGGPGPPRHRVQTTSWFGPPTMELAELLELVATDAPEVLRRPLPPIPEVLERAGLEVVDGLVGHAGTDWNALGLATILTRPAPGATWRRSAVVRGLRLDGDRAYRFVPAARFRPGAVSSAGSVKRAPSVGAWRSLVARIVRDDEVGGSNPLAPTIQASCPASGRRRPHPAIGRPCQKELAQDQASTGGRSSLCSRESSEISSVIAAWADRAAVLD